VVIVNGSRRCSKLLETVLDAGHYVVVFVESSEHAYSQIKARAAEPGDSCVRSTTAMAPVLSMLKLDEETRSIPVDDLHARRQQRGRSGTYTEPSELSCSRRRRPRPG